MVFIAPNLYVVDFISFTDSATHNLEYRLHILAEYLSSVLCGTDEVVEQKIYIVTFVHMVGHLASILIFGDSAAELTEYSMNKLPKPSAMLHANTPKP
jgi:hypothetical protein